ncbi:MAG TPA: hypothetical protein VGG32_06150 [Thermoplasmata archaeon]|jgi:hypothetical protein
MPAKTGKETRYVLLENPRVRTWYEGRALKSRISADVDLRKLRLLLTRLRLDTESVVSLATTDPDRLQDMLVRYAADLKRAGRVDDYVAKTLSGLKSYLRFRRVTFSGFPSLNPIRGSTLSGERVPTPEELGRVLERLSLRGRTIALVMAHAGVRPQVVGDYTGERGLTLGDLPELDLDRLSFQETPFVIRVPADLSKTRMSYRTFGTSQLGATLSAYLSERRGAGETLTPKSPVVVPTDVARLRGATRDSRRGVERARKFMVTGALVREIREALHASAPQGVTWRPYVLRSYCSTRLLIAEGQGRISRDLREAILGHNGGVASRYHVGKRWGEELLAEARREYSNAAEFLETNAQTRMNVAAEFRRTLLAVAGLTKEEAAQHMNDSNDEVLALVRNGLIERKLAIIDPAKGNGDSHMTQKPVSLDEAEKLLSEGWTFVANFGPDRVLLRAPMN